MVAPATVLPMPVMYPHIMPERQANYTMDAKLFLDYLQKRYDPEDLGLDFNLELRECRWCFQLPVELDLDALTSLANDVADLHKDAQKSPKEPA